LEGELVEPFGSINVRTPSIVPNVILSILTTLFLQYSLATHTSVFTLAFQIFFFGSKSSLHISLLCRNKQLLHGFELFSSSSLV
jgi:hypothetical protein